MLNKPQIERMIRKLDRFSEMIEPHIFIKVGELQDVTYCHVDKRYHEIPDLPFQKAEEGMTWQGNTTYCWFKGVYIPTEADDGKTLFIRPNIGCYEGMLFVDGLPFGVFSTKIQYSGHGNHYSDLLKYRAKAGEQIDVAIEFYAGHPSYGTSPEDHANMRGHVYEYHGADICVKDYDLQAFYFDLKTVIALWETLPDETFRKAELETAMLETFRIVSISVEDTPWDVIRDSIIKAAPVLRETLSRKNGDSCGEASIIGHSHMDTAWLWHIGETVKKCARTYSNQLALMQEYPEYKFVQSSSCHSDMIRKYYPELFKKIREAVAAGKYEPNGGVWVECDCNITSGESMIRQFLWGQRFTQKYFNYTSNCFWLPDTFGYSAAIPQIMKGCGVDYFLTTKISWNDTNQFPYDTFYWQGIDGTKVFTHFNTTHHFPAPDDIIGRMGDIKQKNVTDKRLLAFGYGDGGGGPMFEECEYARRVKDTAGCPKVEYSLVGDFMKTLEKTCKNPNTYRGELYLELHRGTLTNQHTIKRNNRKAELALRDLEIATVQSAVQKGAAASEDAIAPLYEVLLMNQFHDILPGTCINAVHEKSRKYTSGVIAEARAKTANLLQGNGDPDYVTVINTLSFDRGDPIFMDYKAGKIVEGGYRQQLYTDLDGKQKLIVLGVKVPAMGSVTLRLIPGTPTDKSAFCVNENQLETAAVSVAFAENGTIKSFVDKTVGRQLVDGRPLNTFIMAEDMPAAWDNWDVDADFLEKFEDVSTLVSRTVISEGEAAYIVRSQYQISEKSTVTQDMIFFADSAQVRFDTAMDWNDDHRFLRTAFDTAVYNDFARYEIQFGCVKRPTTRNNSVEQAKFEVCNHKYTDLSEPRYGVAMLNDCKYGISVKDGSIQLSLHKGGRHPDYKGDKDGIHRCVYAFQPHVGGFGAENVIEPAYMLNVPVLVADGKLDYQPLIGITAPNVIVEAVKPCEDAEKAYIVRLYEAEGSMTETAVAAPAAAVEILETDMLEQAKESFGKPDNFKLSFRPFEIKTLKIKYE